ncbi:MAG TPA: 2-oxo acid dehydrogenase subunit E2 [Deltaproteobacteria bacterium]|jgi:pyruvate dehydrogenase E2 component (dihydrolipoamide acetyltransferase)|nr:2-oxo acid dehydrogenase subunit E2 [Deltaproteobacteria bacterium]
MPVEFKLPDLGEGIHEGEIIEVLVQAGDRVEDGQTVLIVETDKATAEVPSPVTGIVKEVRVKSGQTVRVGEVLIVFLKEGEFEEQTKAPPPKTPEEKRETRLPEGPIAAAPSTRRLARELGIDISQVKPSGPGGRVTPEDVRAFAEGARQAEAEKAPPEAKIPPGPPLEKGGEKKPPEPPEVPALFQFDRAGPVERIPLRSVRRTTAKHVALAWSQIPHVTHMDVADLTELEAFRRKHKQQVVAQGGALSLTVFAMKAAAAALKKFPRFNSSIDMESEEIIIKHYHNIGFAVDTDRGLLVPVIRDVDCKSIFDLAVELKDLAEKTRQGQATKDDMSGGTFTITNVGPMGGTGLCPIINYPEVAILGMAQARLQPKVIGDEKNYEIIPRLMLPLNITFDHRVLDGAEAARFLKVIIETLENPENLLMMS